MTGPSPALYGYYVRLATLGFRRTPILTLLIIVAIGIGVGASMTVYTVFRAMASDPLPHSRKLFVAQIENRPPLDRDVLDEPPSQLTYRDATSLLTAGSAYEQVAMHPVAVIVTPSDFNLHPYRVEARATTGSFFSIFQTPFQFGRGWTRGDDEARTNVVVLSAELNSRIFGGSNSIGRTLSLYDREYRVVGVLRPWNPLPRVFDVVNGPFSRTEDLFLPLTTAVEREIPGTGRRDCYSSQNDARMGSMESECTWVQFWAHLPTPEAAERYRRLLRNYAYEQQRSGRFRWVPTVRLRDARQWLLYQRVIPDEFRLSVILAFSFLAACLINAVGLILAKFDSRRGEFGIRRALGASRFELLRQCITESVAIGVAGGMFGLALTAMGLLLERRMLPPGMSDLAHLDYTSVAITLALAITATVLTGLYPAWRASEVLSADELRTQ